MTAHVPFKKTDVGSSLASIPCAIPGRYLLTALQATAGGNLTFLRDNILYHKDETASGKPTCLIFFKVLDQIAARGRRPGGGGRRANGGCFGIFFKPPPPWGGIFGGEKGRGGLGFRKKD